MDLMLSTEERDVLAEILNERERLLKKEISHTDSREFKVLLRKKEMVLDSILGRLQAREMVHS